MQDISLEDAAKHFDFAVESMNKIWFKADELNIESNYSSGIYCNLLNQFNGILGEFTSGKDGPEYNSAIEAQKKAMDSHPELILALYVLYYFGTKEYDSNDNSKKRLRNIKNCEEEIFEFRNWKDFLDSISSEKYDRTNKYLRKMAEDFFARWTEKNQIIQTVIDNYKNRGVLSSKEIDKDKTKTDNLIETKNKINETEKTKNQIKINRQYESQKSEFIINTGNGKIDNNNLIKNENKINKTSNTKKYGKSEIALVIITILIFLLLIVAIISGNPIFIKAMIAITLIYVVLIIFLICYRDRVSKNEIRKRITSNKNIKINAREKNKSLNLDYESKEKTNTNINQESDFIEEDGFLSP